MLRGLIFLCCLLLVGNARSAETARCEVKSRNVQDCVVPISGEKQTVRISNQLVAVFNNYKTDKSSGIFIQFESGKEVLRRLLLSFNDADSETADRMTVDLRKKIPAGANITALEFEGTQQSVAVRVLHQKDGKIGKVDVFGAN
jgi:hypothetical protein